MKKQEDTRLAGLAAESVQFKIYQKHQDIVSYLSSPLYLKHIVVDILFGT